MKQYLLSVIQPDGPAPTPEVLESIDRDLDALNEELRDAGAWVFAGGLHPPSAATVVQVRGDDVLTTDGPFAEGKEHLGGFTIIRAADLDGALAWARRAAFPAAPPSERGSWTVDRRGRVTSPTPNALAWNG